jgi:hypothetical protein
MSLTGVIVNGRVELGTSCAFPDGSRVRVELEPEEPILSREEELEILRESYRDALAGNVRPAREVLKEIAIRHNIPLEPDE